jgi:hypothetical protein
MVTICLQSAQFRLHYGIRLPHRPGHCCPSICTLSVSLKIFLKLSPQNCLIFDNAPSLLLSSHGWPLFLIANRTPSKTCRLVSERRIHCPNITRHQSMSFMLLCTIQFNITLSSMFQEPNHRTCFPKTSTSRSAQSTFSSQLKLQCPSLEHTDFSERTLEEESGVLPLKSGP